MSTVVLGTIISGSLSDGLLMRMSNKASLETIKTGKFVSVCGLNTTFFSLITDIKLEVSHPDILLFPPTEHELLLKQALNTKDMYALVHLRPMLMLNEQNIPVSVKTVPPHFSPVREATEREIALIFGDEQAEPQKYFAIGTPLDMQAPVCLNLDKLTERSNAIFGKTGTGKTFLTRLMLAGLIKQNKAAVLLFDMHSEYGLQARKETNNTQESFVKGLKTLFSDKIVIFSLDPASTRRRGGMPDVELTIPYSAIAVEDIVSLSSELNLHSTAYEAAYLVYAKHKKKWLDVLLAQGERLKEFAQEIGAHPESVAALYRKLKTIERLPFLQAQAYTQETDPDTETTVKTHTKNNKSDVIDQILEYIDRGISIIIEFGNFTSSFCYLLVANILTRRIHSLYIQKTEYFLGTQRSADEPKKLMIVIEEAHKFLNPQAAKQTIFGTIAREMRKYYVSLILVDQRPSGIDQEVLSQIGTKIIAQLSDEKDIQAVLTGVSNAQQLKTVLASLETKKQAVLLGHATAMPVVIQTREYDQKFYSAMLDIAHTKSVDTLIQELY